MTLRRKNTTKRNIQDPIKRLIVGVKNQMLKFQLSGKQLVNNKNSNTTFKMDAVKQISSSLGTTVKTTLMTKILKKNGKKQIRNSKSLEFKILGIQDIPANIYVANVPKHL